MNQQLAWSGIVAIAFVIGCGGAPETVINVGPMPDGGTYTGVWFSPQYGEMHLVQSGKSVIGEFEKDERTGRIQGKVDGDVLRFQWEENRHIVANRAVTVQGRGYFKYIVGDDGQHYIKGEWGQDDRDSGGGPWNAVKSKARQPKVSSGGGSFDSSSAGGDDSGYSDDYGDSSGVDADSAASEPEKEEAVHDRAPVDDALDGLDQF